MRCEIENYDEVMELLAWSPRKAKNLTAYLAVKPQLVEGLVSQFERENYPETVNVKILEKYLVTYGIAAIAKYDGLNLKWTGKWTACMCELGGDPDPDGLGETAFCSWPDGTVRTVEDWRNSDDVIVCWNAYDYSIDLNYRETARRIQIADVSLDMLVKNSRLHPVPVARDSKEQQAIIDVQQNILDGTEQTVIAAGDTQELLDVIGNTTSKIDVLSLTDPSAAVHIQNISQYREDLLRWFWNLYGMDSRGTTKRAQQSVEEVDQGGDLSMVIPMSRWRARQEEVQQVREKCGAPDAACDFSTCWKSRIMEAVTIDAETAEELQVEDLTPDEENAENEAVAASSEGATTEVSAEAEGEDTNGEEGEENEEDKETV